MVLSTSPGNALEPAPNVLWRRDVTDPSDGSTSTFVTDSKVLQNGNLVIVGQFGGTGPILGSAYDATRDPDGGCFVAVQSAERQLLWLHRLPGLNFLKLHVDSADNISLINYSTEPVSLLGSTLPAEPSGALVYGVSFHPDGTLNHLRRIGQLGNTGYLLRSCYESLADGSLIALEFIAPMTIADKTYTPPDGQQGVLLLKLNEDGTRAWDHVFYSAYTSLGKALPLSDGGQLFWVGLTGPGTFQGQTYSVSSNYAHSLLVWLNAAGEVTKTARIRNDESNAYLTDALLAPDGDLFLQLSGNFAANIEPPTGSPLTISLGDAYMNIALARVSQDLTTLRWQKKSETFETYSYCPLRCDQAGNIYAAFFTTPLYMLFDGTNYRNDIYYDFKATSLLKLDGDGHVLWQRFEQSPLPTALDVSPNGQIYLASCPYLRTLNSTIVSIAPNWEFSPPELTKFIFTNQVVATGSTVKIFSNLNGPEGTVYYWTKNGIPFTNSTVNTISITNFSTADVATYSVTSSNQFGTATSGPFTFTIAPPSKLATSQILEHLQSSAVYDMKGTFSPNGRHYLYSAYADNLITDSNIYYFATNHLHCRVSLDGESPASFTVTLPSQSFPSQLIGDDGSCFLMSSNINTAPLQKRSWLAKYGPTGNKLWEIDALSATGGYFKDIALFQKTNLVLSVYCKSGTVFSGQQTFTQSGLYLIRMSFEGDVLDTKLLLASETELGRSLSLAPDGSGYLLAEFPGSLEFSNGNVLGEDFAHPSAIFGFDTAGNITWAQRLPSQLQNYLHSIACDSQGVVFSLNYTGLLDVAGFPSGSMFYGALIVRWNKNGTMEWYRRIDDPTEYEYTGGLVLDAAGNVFFGLTTTKDLIIDGVTFPFNFDSNKDVVSQALLVQLYRDGRLADAFRIPSSGSTSISSVDIDPKGRVLYSGQIAAMQTPNAILQIGDYEIQQNPSGSGSYYNITAPLGPVLLSSRQGDELNFNWSDYLSGFTLESSASPAGPWTPVTTSTNSITVESGASGSQFFRLKLQAE